LSAQAEQSIKHLTKATLFIVISIIIVITTIYSLERWERSGTKQT